MKQGPSLLLGESNSRHHSGVHNAYVVRRKFQRKRQAREIVPIDLPELPKKRGVRSPQTRPHFPRLSCLMSQKHPVLVIPPHRESGHFASQTKNPGGIRTSGDEIPDKNDLVIGRGTERFEQTLKLTGAAVHVTDPDGPRHGRKLTPS